MKRQLNRRTFLQKATAATGFWVSGLPAQTAERSALEKLHIGIIGVNHRGRGNMLQLRGENIVALCDVDESYLARAKRQYPRARIFHDWRKLLEAKFIDAVVISTPDHSHAAACAMALKLDKHVYCEKPLTHTVHEARVIGDLARASSLATQTGTQMHANSHYRRVVEWIRSGVVGQVSEVHVWCNRTFKAVRRPKEKQPIPRTLHWDFWLGPAPARPYHRVYLPTSSRWKIWWDFGNGVLGNMGSHLLDLPFWALDLRHPTTIEAEGPPVDPDVCPHSMRVRWQFPVTAKHPPIKLVWYHGDRKPELPRGVAANKWSFGILFVGKAGMLLADHRTHILLPADRFRDFKAPEKTIPPSPGHFQEWIRACKEPKRTLCNFDYAATLTEALLLGNVAYRTGKKITWDAVKAQVLKCPEATPFLHREYRKGWTL